MALKLRGAEMATDALIWTAFRLTDVASCIFGWAETIQEWIERRRKGQRAVSDQALLMQRGDDQ